MKTWNEITRAEQIERWEQVVRVLKGLTPHQRRKHWDMSVWAQKTECGTVACAAGYCGMDPWFRRRGFGLISTYCNLQVPSCRTDIFFGPYADSVFCNPSKSLFRPVSTVIKEVQSVIKTLKAEAS